MQQPSLLSSSLLTHRYLNRHRACYRYATVASSTKGIRVKRDGNINSTTIKREVYSEENVGRVRKGGEIESEAQQTEQEEDEQEQEECDGGLGKEKCKSISTCVHTDMSALAKGFDKT